MQTAIPFADEGQALRLSIEESPYYQTLNGTWKFHWVADPEKRPKDFFKPNYDVSGWDNIKVPATWQIELYAIISPGTSLCIVIPFTLSVITVKEYNGPTSSNLARQTILLPTCPIP